MIIKKLEFIQKKNDVYFLENIGSSIVINDNYSGILILNNKFDIIKKISFIEEVTIYSSYTNDINEELLLYCPDNNIFIYINIKNYGYRIIKLKNPIKNMVFSNHYIWHDNIVLLSTYKSEFVLLNVERLTAKIIDFDQVIQKYPNFYKSIDYQNNDNVFKLKVAEERIEIYINNSIEFVYPDNGFIFLKAIVCSENNLLVAICSKKSDVSSSKLIVYSIV